MASNSGQTHMQSVVMKKRKAGRKKFQETRHPVYKGVRQRFGKWVCELRQPDKNYKSRIWLGTFTCPDMAARAYDVAAWALKRDPAALNFPQEANALPQCAAAHELSSCSSSSSSVSLMEKVEEEGSREVVYLDEEELFNMPELLDSMAEGLILTPPAMQKGFNWDEYDDHGLEKTVDFTLWSD